ncbi:hypothetical protein UY286_23585 [Paenibacillus polymyxa]|uniref:hypothetical protein n=1 Tax=Paenibacillus polymyxa TaxID=1406 RepID=UPI002AB3A839|nr:hypothetical protein [Paenibacillus polymyxa]MDY8120405.1 hypothetical protein [Paenibacillus polymyxa]
MKRVFYLERMHPKLLCNVVKEYWFEGSPMLITRVDSIVAYSLVLTLELKIVMISV